MHMEVVRRSVGKRWSNCGFVRGNALDRAHRQSSGAAVDAVTVRWRVDIAERNLRDGSDGVLRSE